MSIRQVQTWFAVFALESGGACKTWGLLKGSYKLKVYLPRRLWYPRYPCFIFPGVCEVSDVLSNTRHTAAMGCCLGMSPEQQGNQHGTETSQTMIQSKPFPYS